MATSAEHFTGSVETDARKDNAFSATCNSLIMSSLKSAGLWKQNLV